MPYATLDDLIARYGEEELLQRTDRAGAGTLNPAVADQALADASAEMDGYLASRYRLPLPSVPEVLRRICCAIARYRLWEDLASERVRQDYEDARRFMEALSRGDVSLGLPADLPAPQPVAGVAHAAPARVFGRGVLDGY